ncbi:MAG TPA: 5,10-methylenetetrahydrofolate reductase [Dehalococcoidia bacterium]|nr:5,10-methylenetetrahydrofolate reductase [Dehalococcoidia bacterium]
MIISELKPLSEILGYLEGERKIFLVGCKGCAEVCHTGDEPQVLEMKQKLEQEGKTVTGYCVIDFLCDKALVKTRLLPHEAEIDAADSLLVMTCGIGVQATAAVVNKLTHPATNTISLGGARGEWRGSERCRECGDCVLDLTGGICPLTACTKGLINGPCGGAKDGRCEVEPDVRECGWQLIYERLKKLGRLEKMKAMPPPKNYLKMQPPKQLRSTIMWALEQQETKV